MSFINFNSSFFIRPTSSSKNPIILRWSRTSSITTLLNTNKLPLPNCPNNLLLGSLLLRDSGKIAQRRMILKQWP